MQFDRTMTISAANSRKAVNWQPQALLWSEFIGKLTVPVRSPETVAAYLAMRKAQQDELKDVGGFVGGKLCGRRKKGAVEFRDLVTLDMDNLPPGSTSEVYRRAEGLGVGYALYSTRKHRPDAPRLRLVALLDRSTLPDEYEPIARKLAALIQPEMTWFDPTTFQPERLMYWPSVCADGEYFMQYADKPMLSADGMLGLYPNWHDVTAWPTVPGEAKLRANAAKKQGNPTEKPGVVGAFCRTYDIEAAMDKFIPGVYVETAQDGRYTYAEGSTAGGAVLYDDGKFLYSHHATDPCGGQLVNAFDMVRLHKFSELDDSDEVKPGTPVGRLPSYAAMIGFARSDPAVSDILAREAFASAVDDFGSIANEDAALALGRCEREPLSAEITKAALRAFSIRVRRNLISGRVEIEGMPETFSREESINTLPIFLLDKLRAIGVRGVSKTALSDYLANIADENRYNPVTDMMHSTVWDGKERFPELLRIMGLRSDSLHAVLVRKWMLQSTALAHNDAGTAKAAEGVLVLKGAQGAGKTLWCRKISVFPEWFVEGAVLDMTNKDTLLNALGGWICELGELDGTLKREQVALKAFVTSTSDRIRAPYAREATDRPRRTSLVATVNPDCFLRDETGDRRFWVVPVDDMNLPALLALPREWFIQLWAEQYRAYLENPEAFRLTANERQALDTANQSYRELLPGEEELLQAFNWGLPPEQWGRFSPSELKWLFFGGERITAQQIGRALAKLAREDDRITFTTAQRVKRYCLPIRKNISAAM